MVRPVRTAAASAASLALAIGLAIGLAGCDKLGTLGGGNEQQPASQLGVPLDPALAGMVRRADGGLLLRRDLPLPATFTLTWERSDELSAAHRVRYGTQPGRPSEPVNESIPAGRFLSTAILQRVTPERYTLTIPSAAAPEPPGKDPAATSPPPVSAAGAELAGCSVTLLRSHSAWSVAKTAGPADFKTINWGQNLTPDFDALLRLAGLTTSPRWLGDPLVPGREIRLSGADTGILLGSPATGALVLRYEGEESLAGHPCAAFSVSGRYQTEPVLHWHGQYESEEMVVESGRAYLSLLYPLVVGLDLKGILALSTWAAPGATGTPTMMLQGRTHRKLMAVPDFPAG